MTNIDVYSLEKLFKYIGTTRCGETRDFICGAIANKWTKEIAKNRSLNDYFSPLWSGIEFISETNGTFNILTITSTAKRSVIYGNDLNVNPEFSAMDIMLLITTALEKYGYIAISIDYELDHVFVLCKTNSGRVIIDSFVNQREAEIRPYDESLLYDFLQSPSDDLFDKLCKFFRYHKLSSKEDKTLVINIEVPSGNEIFISDNKVTI